MMPVNIAKIFSSQNFSRLRQVTAVRGAQCCSREGVKGELTWTERSRAGVNELSKNFHNDVTLTFFVYIDV